MKPIADVALGSQQLVDQLTSLFGSVPIIKKLVNLVEGRNATHDLEISPAKEGLVVNGRIGSGVVLAKLLLDKAVCSLSQLQELSLRKRTLHLGNLLPDRSKIIFNEGPILIA